MTTIQPPLVGLPTGTMDELAYLVRLQKYHKRTRRELQHRLNKAKSANDTQRTILLAHPLLQKSLAECIRTGDKVAFNLVYDTLQRLWTRYLDITQPERIDLGRRNTQRTRSCTEHPASLERLSHQSREVIFCFLTNLMSNTSFLLERLMVLDQRQLKNLLHESQHTNQTRSVLGHSTSSPRKRVNSPDFSRSEGKDRSHPHDPFHHSPLTLLFDIAGTFPIGNTDTVHRCQERLWATICAQMLTETRPGRERFIISVLDYMARQSRPTANASLEIWIKQTLRDGHSFLTGRESSFLGNGHDTERNVARDEAFYLASIRKLFLLLRNNDTTNLIPQRILNMCQDIVSKLRNCDTKFRSAPFFFIAHWLFANYLPDAIIAPESVGLMLDEYFSDTARHHLLRETILRAQRIVVDVSYSWNHTGAVDALLKADVEAIADHFRPVTGPRELPDTPNDTGEADDDWFIRGISSPDILSLIHSLYPKGQNPPMNPLSSTQSVFDTPMATPSIDGLSFFRQTSLGEGGDFMQIPGAGSDLSNDSDTWAIPDSDPRETDPRGSTHVGDSKTDFNEETALHAACKELESLEDTGISSVVSSSESLSLLGARQGRITILDGTHMLGGHEEELRLFTESDTNEFRRDEITNYSYVLVRKAVLKLLSDALALGPGVNLADHGKNSFCEGDFPLSRLFETAIRREQRSGNFTTALGYTRAVDNLGAILKRQTGTEHDLLRNFIHDVKRSIARARNASFKLTTVVSQMEQQCLENDNIAIHIVEMAETTRAKMWYCTDVRTSAMFANLQRLADALRSMSNSAYRPKKKTEPPTLRHKGTLKPKTLNSVQRGEASVLDIMVTDPAYHVECKLKDEQVSLTKLWIKHHNIENICIGEERLHRLLCEISKCLSHLTNADPMVSPVLWGSELFQTDRLDGENEAFFLERANEGCKDSNAFHRPTSSGLEGVPDYRGNVCQPSEFCFSGSSLLADSFRSRSPTLGTRSSTSFWSPSGVRSMSPLSNVSSPSRAWSPIYMRPAISRESFQSSPKVKALTSELRSRINGLILSDILQVVFPFGSETDMSFFRDMRINLADRLTETDVKSSTTGANSQGSRTELNDSKREPDNKNIRGPVSSGPREPYACTRHQPSRIAMSSIFDMHDAKKQLIRKFDLTCNPLIKMQVLCDLETLMVTSKYNTQLGEKRNILNDATPRASTSRIRILADDVGPQNATSALRTRPGYQNSASVKAFGTLFSDQSTRPANLFRDLQTIASLVPVEIQDRTQAGQSFWSATAAALSLKQSMTQRCVELADSVIGKLTNAVKQGAVSSSELSTSSVAFDQLSPPNGLFSDGIEQTPLMKAFKLLRVAAMQSHPVAQRELATLYLTHWEQLPRVLAPFASCAEVFRAKGAKWTKKCDDGRQYDSETMCIAMHWMELSAAGGDALAQSLCNEGI